MTYIWSYLTEEPSIYHTELPPLFPNFLSDLNPMDKCEKFRGFLTSFLCSYMLEDREVASILPTKVQF